MLVWHTSGIIDNGGFEYLFAGEFFSDPDYHITAEAYLTAGLLRAYEAFQEAFALFPDGKVHTMPPSAMGNIWLRTGRPAIGSIESFGKTATTEAGKRDWPSSFGSSGAAEPPRCDAVKPAASKSSERAMPPPRFPPDAPFSRGFLGLKSSGFQGK